VKHATSAAQEYQDNALEVVRALRLPDQGYRQLMHSENNIVALETVLSFDSEDDRDEVCEILDTLSVGCEFDLENFTEEQMTLFIKYAQKIKDLLKWYYIAKKQRADDTQQPSSQTLMDALKLDKDYYDKTRLWNEFIMAPERTVQEY
jgi:hypothetical protein